MTKSRAALALAAALTLWSHAAAAQSDVHRQLSDSEMRAAIEALLWDPTADLSEDPSCKADLGRPGGMSIAKGLAVALLRAATDRKPVTVSADCFVRPGYPLAAGQEYCRLALTSADRPRGAGYGLVFVMDWKDGRVRPSSVECF